MPSSVWFRIARTNHLMQRGGRCHYCREPLTCAQVTADHKIPRSRGGKNQMANIAACCFACNQAKADKTESRFFAEMGKSKPSSADPNVLAAYIRRRINKKVNRACERIMEACR